MRAIQNQTTPKDPILMGRAFCILFSLALSASVLANHSDKKSGGNVDVEAYCAYKCDQFESLITGYESGLTRLNLTKHDHILTHDQSSQEISVPKPAKHTRLIFTTDIKTARLIAPHRNNLPLLIGMVRPTDDLTEFEPYSAILLGHPIETQLTFLKQVLPRTRKIGVIYSTEANAHWVKGMELVAKALDLELLQAKIDTPQEHPYALKKIVNRVDVILGVADPIVLSRQTAKQTLLTSFRSYIPFIGLSREWTKAGALYSPEIDLSEVGFQAAEITNNMIKLNSRALETRLYSLDVFQYSINLKTARHMRIEIPHEIVDQASEVYR